MLREGLNRMISVNLNQVTSIQDGPLYRVKNEILEASGISKALFTYSTASQAFSNYATPADMEQWPESYEAAVQDAKTFYRLAYVQRDWTTIHEMNSDLVATRGRIQALIESMNELQGSIASDVTTTLSTE